MATPTTTFKVKGPIFEKPTQVSLGFTEAVNRGLLDLVIIEGSNKVKEDLWGPTSDAAYKKSTPSQRHGAKTRTLKRAIGGSVPRDGIGQIDAGENQYGSNLIYSSWVEGISSRNKRSTFKGYGMFQNAYDHINNNPKLYEQYIGDALIEAFK
jgi:hypothetical protein